MSNSQSLSPKALDLLKEGQALSFADPPDYAAAEQSFRKALEIAPNWGEAYHLLANALKQQSKLEVACEAEREAIRLLPGDPRPLISFGWFLHLSGQSAKAVQFLEEGLNLKPHYGEADALFMLSEAFESLGQNEKATLLWKKLLSMESTYPSYDRPMKEARKKLLSQAYY
jgi:Tfp pilus assembly protein PilF